MSEPPPDSNNNIYFPGAFYQLYTVEPPCFSNGDLPDDYSLRHQRTEGLLALSLANRMRLPSRPSLFDRLRGGIQEHVTHV